MQCHAASPSRNRPSTGRKWKRVVKTTTRVACIAAGVVIAALALVVALPGYDLRVVRSDSMNPVFYAGDMVMTVPEGSPLGGRIKPGTIITYDLDGEMITHRAVSLDQGMIVAKGDANEEADPRKVAASQVEGIYVMRIPYAGHLSVFLHTKTGWFLLVILPTFLLLGLIVKEIIKEAFRADKPAHGMARDDKPLKPSNTG